MIEFTPIILSVQLAAVTTVILLVICIPLAWWLAHTRHWSKTILESVIALPLVLPPTVIGFYLLLLLGQEGPLGSLWHALGGGALVFTFSGLVIGSVVYSLPFVLQPLQNSFETIGKMPLEVASTLRASPLDAFFTVIMPRARRGIITASVLGFAHTLGEFGIVLMIGGNIPEKTRVVSIAIYDQVEQLEYTSAHILSFGLLLFSFLLLYGVFSINRRQSRIVGS